MKKWPSILVCGLTVALLLAVTAPAYAFPQFFKVFETKYVGEGSTPTQMSIAAAIEEVKKCNVCHDPRKIDGKVSKKNRNPFGEELAKMLTKEDKDNEEKIMKALEEVAGMKADGADKTYGALLESGKLPYVTKVEE